MGKLMDLPFDLLEMIEDKVVFYADKVRMRAVCKSLRRLLPKINHDFPWLLQAVDDNVEASHTVFNPIDEKCYHLDLQNVLQGKIWKGSSHGWVFTVQDTMYSGNAKEDCNKIYLINPLTRARIELPSRDKFSDVEVYNPDQVNEEYSLLNFHNPEDDVEVFSSQKVNEAFTHKFVMSSDPSGSEGEDCIIVALYARSRVLAYCTLKDEGWTYIPVEVMENDIVTGFNDDIIFRRDKLYAMTQTRHEVHVIVVDYIITWNPRITHIATHSNNLAADVSYLGPSYIISECYIVESSDKRCIFVIERFIEGIEITTGKLDSCRTLYFKVYKVNLVNGRVVEVKGIGKDVVILGLNSSIAISSCSSTEYKGNHIYFSDSCFTYDRQCTAPGYSEIGVFSLKDKSLEPLPGYNSSPNLLLPPPIWVDLRYFGPPPLKRKCIMKMQRKNYKKVIS